MLPPARQSPAGAALRPNCHVRILVGNSPLGDRSKFHLEAEVRHPSNEAIDHFDLVALIEVVRAKVVVGGTVAKHVVGGGEHGGGHGKNRLFGATPGF